MIHYRCTNCGADMESPDALAGKEDNCPACGKAITVPGSDRRSAFWERFDLLTDIRLLPFFVALIWSGAALIQYGTPHTVRKSPPRRYTFVEAEPQKSTMLPMIALTSDTAVASAGAYLCLLGACSIVMTFGRHWWRLRHLGFARRLGRMYLLAILGIGVPSLPCGVLYAAVTDKELPVAFVVLAPLIAAPLGIPLGRLRGYFGVTKKV